MSARSSPHPGDCIPGRSLSWPGWGVHGSLLPAVFTGTPTNRLDILPPRYDLIAGARDYCFSNSCFIVLLFLSSALPSQVCGLPAFSCEMSVGDAMCLARFRGQEGCCLGAVHPPHLPDLPPSAPLKVLGRLVKGHLSAGCPIVSIGAGPILSPPVHGLTSAGFLHCLSHHLPFHVPSAPSLACWSLTLP